MYVMPLAKRAMRLHGGLRMPERQRGMASLIVAMVLLGIISIMTLFTLSYGIQNRRALAVESATRVVQEAAQAGLDQAVQFFRARTFEIASTWLTSAPGLSRWERCAPSDVSVPCGAVAASVRANYWRYHDDGRADPTALDMRDAFTDSTGAPVQQLVTSAGDYRIAYDVHALLCLVDTDMPDLQCRPSSDSAAPENNGKAAYPGPYAITLIARARLSESDADAVKAIRQAIVKETIATRRTEGAAQSRLGVVPGSWSDAGGIDGRGNYAER